MQGGFGCGHSQLPKAEGGETKKQRSKRTQRTGEKAAPRSKKRRKDEEEKPAMYATADTFTHLKQVSLGGSPLGSRGCEDAQWFSNPAKPSLALSCSLPN